MTTIEVPEKVMEIIRRRGLDPETFIVEAVQRVLELDPKEEVVLRLNIAKHMIRRAREELDRGDPIQASEKLYKAAEECVKILADLFKLEESRRAREEGGWWSKLLSKAARKLALRLGEKLILDAWSQAYDLHVHGFHEHSLGVEEVRQSLPIIEKLVEYTSNKIKQVEEQKEK